MKLIGRKRQPRLPFQLDAASRTPERLQMPLCLPPSRNVSAPVTALLLVLASHFGCASGMKAHPYARRYLVAVMQIENHAVEKDAEPFLESVRSILITELISSGRLRLIERDRVDVIVREQVLGKTGLIETDSAMKVGRLLGAQAVLLARVNALKIEKNATTFGDARASSLTIQASLDARLIHAETGEILAASEERFTDTSREFRAGQDDIRTGNIDRKVLVGHVLENGARALARKLAALVPQR